MRKREWKKAKEKTEKVSASNADTLIFTPERIGVTKLVQEFIPYPQYDGGTGMRVSFSIGIQNRGKTYQVDVHGSEFFSENITEEKAKKEENISSLMLSHYLASKTPKSYLDVMTINNEVVKISRRSMFIADEFYPTEVIWTKK